MVSCSRCKGTIITDLEEFTRCINCAFIPTRLPTSEDSKMAIQDSFRSKFRGGIPPITVSLIKRSINIIFERYNRHIEVVIHYDETDTTLRPEKNRAFVRNVKVTTRTKPSIIGWEHTIPRQFRHRTGNRLIGLSEFYPTDIARQIAIRDRSKDNNAILNSTQ